MHGLVLNVPTLNDIAFTLTVKIYPYSTENIAKQTSNETTVFLKSPKLITQKNLKQKNFCF